MTMASALGHRGVQLIVGGWTFFIAENLILSENREYLVSELGESGYRNVYGCLSTLACGSIAVGYLRFGRGKGPVVFPGAAGVGAQTAAFALQTLGLVGFSQLAPPLQLPVAVAPVAAVNGGGAQIHPPVGSEAAKTTKEVTSTLGLKAQCPINFDHSRRQEGKEVVGIKRVTRHPVLWSMAYVGMGAAMGSPLITEIVFGLCPSLMAIIGGWHTDFRHRKSGALRPSVDGATSALPFAALLEGRQSWAELADDVAWSNAGLAVAGGTALALRRHRAFAAAARAIAK